MEVSFDGTYLQTMSTRPFFKAFHISSTGDCDVNRSRMEVARELAQFLSSSRLALLQVRIFLCGGLLRLTLAVASKRIAAWSLTPTIVSVRFTNDGLFVNTKSKQLFSRVGSLTSCSRPSSSFISRNILLIYFWY